MSEYEWYKQIADNDPGGDLDAAFAAMSAETITEDKPLDERMINERGVFAVIGMAKGEALMQAIEASPESAVPARVKAWFKPSEQGVDVLDHSVQAVFAAMAEAGIISGADRNALEMYGKITKTKYEGLTETKLQNARDMVAKGIY